MGGNIQISNLLKTSAIDVQSARVWYSFLSYFAIAWYIRVTSYSKFGVLSLVDASVISFSIEQYCWSRYCVPESLNFLIRSLGLIVSVILILLQKLGSLCISVLRLLIAPSWYISLNVKYDIILIKISLGRLLQLALVLHTLRLLVVSCLFGNISDVCDRVWVTALWWACVCYGMSFLFDIPALLRTPCLWGGFDPCGPRPTVLELSYTLSHMFTQFCLFMM